MRSVTPPSWPTTGPPRSRGATPATTRSAASPTSPVWVSSSGHYIKCHMAPVTSMSPIIWPCVILVIGPCSVKGPDVLRSHDTCLGPPSSWPLWCHPSWHPNCPSMMSLGPRPHGLLVVSYGQMLSGTLRTLSWAPSFQPSWLSSSPWAMPCPS